MNNDKNIQNKLSGRYEIVEQIGIGGMSYVYKAYDTKKKRIVAIKVLKDEFISDAEFVKKFKTEALSSKEIKHKNVIGAYDVVDEEKMHYIVMEYVDGETLTKYLKNKKKLSNEETISIALQIARGIQAAHQKGIIHRDIKPQNIVIDSHKVVKIADFGIARAVTSTTKNISVVGTVHYMSPEQVRNTIVDFRSDIYSFGCTMFEMITGEVPFKGDKPLEIIVSHLRENIEKPSNYNNEIYKSLEKIILKSTRMLPRERYQSIEDMINDLELALKDKTGSYITDVNTSDDEEGKTVIITDDDMKVIKAVSEKYTNKTNYENKNDDGLTPDQKEFFDRYIKNSTYKQHLLLRKILLVISVIIVLLVLFMILLVLDTKKNKNTPATNSNIIDNIDNYLIGIDIDLAKNLAMNYGITLNEIGEEYNDDIGYRKIISVKETEDKKVIDVIVSKGSFVMDFTDINELQNTKWIDMKQRLDDRQLKYSISEIYDTYISRGYIIGVNKKYSNEKGDLIFTISKGLSDTIKTMPNLYKKSISDAREVLSMYELVLGSVSFVRDYNVEENAVIRQSVPFGTDVKAGTKIDLILSCGPDGQEYIAESTEKWHSELSSAFTLTKDNAPITESSTETRILQVRLVQNTDEGTVYTELINPQEYKYGTVIPLVFTNIEGEPNIQYGQVQVVDVENDKVLYSVEIMFWPNK